MKRLSIALLLAMTAAAQAAPFDVTDAWFRALPGKLHGERRFVAIKGTSHPNANGREEVEHAAAQPTAVLLEPS